MLKSGIIAMTLLFVAGTAQAQTTDSQNGQQNQQGQQQQAGAQPAQQSNSQTPAAGNQGQATSQTNCANQSGGCIFTQSNGQYSSYIGADRNPNGPSPAPVAGQPCDPKMGGNCMAVTNPDGTVTGITSAQVGP